ncbi:AAA family ATPase [Hyphococcus sp.]|uniref:AAA family ATPase n=1 Tax=Hyphococcus sp. TaxID=2038636 RepID=UPI0035C779CD
METEENEKQANSAWLDTGDGLLTRRLDAESKDTRPSRKTDEKELYPLLKLNECNPALSSSYIVKGLFHRNCLSIVWGETGSRKTFALLDGAVAIASGQERWHGRRARQARVVYVCAEGGDEDARNRLAAIRENRPDARTEFALIPTPVAIDNAQSLNRLLATIKSSFGEAKADLLIFDTLSVCLHSVDEYHNGEVARMIARLRALMRLLGGAHIILVHHTGHSFNRERGAYAWRANADVSIEISYDDTRDLGLIIAHKVRHGRTGVIGAFGCREVHLGVDEDGDPVATLAVFESNAPDFEKSDPEKGLTALQSEILEEIDIGLTRNGVRLQPDPDQTETLALDRNILNDRMRKAGIIGDPEEATAPLSSSDRSRIRDNLDTLRARGLIGRNARYVWRISKIEKQGIV